MIATSQSRIVSFSRARRMEHEEDTWPGEVEVLKAVFPLLPGQDLGACLCVCKKWREVASDDYLWKQLCARRWPSVLCGSSGDGRAMRHKDGPMMATGGSRTYYYLFSNFYKKTTIQPMMPPKLRFEDLEFYVDIWSGSRPLYSTVVPGPSVLARIVDPPTGISQMLQDHLQSESYKLTLAVSPRFSVPKLSESLQVSMLIRRCDDQRVACIMDMSTFDYVDGHGPVSHAFDFLQISPLFPFVPPMRAWAALLFFDSVDDREVFGIELDFVDAANSEKEVLCLLEILDWKSIG